MYWVNKLTTDQALSTRFATLTGELRASLDAGGLPPQPGLGDKPTGVSGDDVVNAASAITELPPVAVGENCYVAWSDGQKYIGNVKEAGKGQCLIAFPDGREDWIANDYITNE